MREGSDGFVKKEPDIFVGLDLGTSKVSVVVAEKDSRSDEAQIIGVGQAPSAGIRKGMIVNLEQAVLSVRKALKEAETMVGFPLNEVTVAFSGVEIDSVVSHGMVSLGRTPRQIDLDDVERVIETAQSELAVSSNRCVLHTIPVKYSIDGNSGIDDPLGMTGIRLEIELQSVVVSTTALQNVVNCVERADVSVTGLVVKPLVAALGALSAEERTAGAVVISIGGGTTGVAIFVDGRPIRLSVIPIGGDHITNDLAYVAKIPISVAEELKKRLSLEPSEEEDEFEVVIRGKAKTLPSDALVEVVSCRLEELFSHHIRSILEGMNYHAFPSGIIVTGGVALTEGLENFVSEVMGLPVRVGIPVVSHQMPPGMSSCQYASLAGIVRYLVEKDRHKYRYIETPIEVLRGGGYVSIRSKTPRYLPKGGDVTGVFDSIKRAFKDLF